MTMPKFEPWDFIDKAAQEMGVSAEARRKWRERGVPHRWRMKLMDAAGAKRIKLDPRVFDEPPARAAA